MIYITYKRNGRGLGVEEFMASFELMTGESSSDGKPHALVFPYPTQGHINPSLHLAKTLVAHGFVVTFVNLRINHDRVLSLHRSLPRLLSACHSDLRFEAVSDGLPAEFDRWASYPVFMNALQNTVGPAIVALGRAQSDPPVTCVVSGTFCPWLQDVADSLGVPRFLFWTQSASVFAIYSHLPTLIHHGFFPYNNNQDSIGKPPDMIDYISGLDPIPSSFLPTLIQVDNPSNIVCKLFVVDEFDRMKEAKYILVNSFDELEPSVLDSMRSHVPPILPIGPIFLKSFLNQCNNGDNILEFGLSFWKEDMGLLQWLDKQDESSVLYIAFGSIVTLSPEQVKELSDGLKASKQPFIWALRPGHNLSLKTDKLIELLPEGFVEETRGQGVCVEWAPQVHVLSHPSVGGFLTHCGWNSTLESISMGMPMLPWPHFSDQTTNSWLVVHQWKVGLEFERDKDGIVKKDELARAITALMKTEEGSALRRRVRELKDNARRAVLDGGSSDKSLRMLSQACKEGLQQP